MRFRSHVLLVVDNAELILSTTDLEVGMKYRLPVEEIVAGAATVSLMNLRQFVENMPDGDIEISNNNVNALLLRSVGFECAIVGLSADDFPILPELRSDTAEVLLATADFSEAIHQTLFAASTDESRQILSGCLLTWDGSEIVMVTTDTHRLAVKKFTAIGYCPDPISVIIPSRCLQIVQDLLTRAVDCWFGIQGGTAFISVGNITFCSRLIEGTFPDYQRVIPTTHTCSILCQRDKLRAALRRASVVADYESSKVILQITESSLIIKAKTECIGETREELPIQIDGCPRVGAFNSGFLKDILKVLDCKFVRFDFSDANNAPCLITIPDCDDFLCVVMPMKFEEDDYAERKLD